MRTVEVVEKTLADGLTLTQADTGTTGVIGTPPSTNTNTTTTSYTTFRALGYAFIPPPPGMAAGMLAAASFIPYEGTIGLNPGFPFQRFIATRCNIFGGEGELQSAGAIIQSAEILLQSGEVNLRAGAPSGVTLQSQLANLSMAEKDNIRLL